jgi:hypothetical protein
MKSAFSAPVKREYISKTKNTHLEMLSI